MNDRLCKKYFGDFPNLNSRNKRKRAIQRINAGRRLDAKDTEKLLAEIEKKRQKDEAKRLKRDCANRANHHSALLERGEEVSIGAILD